MKNARRACWFGLGALLLGTTLILLHCLRPSSTAGHPEIPPDSFHHLKEVLSQYPCTVHMKPVGGGAKVGIQSANLSGQEAKTFCGFLERHLDAALSSYPLRAITGEIGRIADEPFAEIVIASESGKARILVFYDMYTPETRSDINNELYRVGCPGLRKMVVAGLVLSASSSSAQDGNSEGQ